MQSLKFAVRQLRRSPAFAATVGVTLALSIGANTAIFSIVDALLLKDLPYAQPERIGSLFARTTGAESFDIRRNVDGARWELMRDHVPSLLPALSSLRTNGVYLQSGSQVQYLQPVVSSSGWRCASERFALYEARSMALGSTTQRLSWRSYWGWR